MAAARLAPEGAEWRPDRDYEILGEIGGGAQEGCNSVVFRIRTTARREEYALKMVVHIVGDAAPQRRGHQQSSALVRGLGAEWREPMQLPPHEFEVCEGAHVLRMWWDQVRVTNPSKGDDSLHSALRPRECRERRMTYAAPFLGRLRCQLDGARTWTVDRSLGELPIMVRSCRCALAGKAPEELVRLREEANELGGYFIINGNEKVVRLLQVPRRNFAAAVTRSSYKNRGPQFSDKGVSMRCARLDRLVDVAVMN